MPIISACPSCGSSLSIEEDAGEVTCQYCGTRFLVNLDGVAPSFHVAPPSVPLPPAVSGSEPALELNPGDNMYNPPIPGSAAVPPAELYNPPVSNAGAEQPGTPTIESPFYPPPAQRGFFTGKRLWISISVVAMVLFCTSCLCMVILAQRVIK